jgi:predicted DCC family thiol-disulfide oxidoreductase YuxK
MRLHHLPAPTSLLVLYDRDCGFCAWMLALLLRRDRHRRLRPAPIQGPEGERLLAGVPRTERLASWHAVDAAGRRTSAGAALAEVLRRLPGGSAPAAVCRLAPGATERAYGWVARHRRLLSRPVPAPAKARARALVAAREAQGAPREGRVD